MTRDDSGELTAEFTASLPQLLYEVRTSQQTIALLLNVYDDITSTAATKREATEALRHALQALDMKLGLIEERMLEDESLRPLRTP